jgi:signal peptidase II
MVSVFGVALFIGVIDRLAKIMASARLSGGRSVRVIPDIFHLTLVLNKGSAFGLFKEGRIFFIISSFLAIFFIIFYVWKHRIESVILSAALGLILGGAVGNLVDRIRFGYVVDFLDFRVWPVFNIAYSAITVGVGILVFKIIFGRGKWQGSGGK